MSFRLQVHATRRVYWTNGTTERILTRVVIYKLAPMPSKKKKKLTRTGCSALRCDPLRLLHTERDRGDGGTRNEIRVRYASKKG